MKRMLLSVDLEESRAAVVEDGKLTHLEIEPVARDSCKGNIYRGVIARVEPSLQSAFVDFGRDKQGFLPVGEIHPKLRPENADKRAPIQELLRAGQQVIVQVQRDEIGQKGATLSTFVSLPGRYLVLMPETDKTGVSRKLSDGARERIKELTDTMKVPDGFGLIVRTAGDAATKLELSKDLVYLNRLWEHIQTNFEQGRGPTLLYQERSLAVRFVRDYYRRDIEEIVIDDDDALDEVKAYLSVLMTKNMGIIERYAGTIPLFARYGIQGQVEDVFSRQVPLPSGGSIVIDQTEALVAIDVNSGRAKTKDIEQTALQTNLEAAEEVARQLVLRDLGGLVVVDFIDMRDPKAVRAVEATIKSAMKNDKARHKIGKISEFGLLELSRQRLKSSVNKGAFDTCIHCSGTGFYRTAPSVAASVLRRIYELVARGGVSYVIAQVPPDAAAYLLNNKRSEITDIERQYHVSVEIVAVEGLTATQVTIEHLSKVPETSTADRLRVARFDRDVQQLDLVRNRLLKREETRIERQLAARLSGARIDYAEVYADVGERAADIKAEEAAATAAASAKAERKAAAVAAASAKAQVRAPVVAEVEEEPIPQPSGLFGWLRGLFGGGKPTPATTVSALEVEPAAVVSAPRVAAPVASAPASAEAAVETSTQARAERQGGERAERGDRGERSGRRDRRDRRDRGDRPERGERGEREVAAATVSDEEQVAVSTEDGRVVIEAASDAAETSTSRRRRGGRRRRGRDREAGEGNELAGGEADEAADGNDGADDEGQNEEARTFGDESGDESSDELAAASADEGADEASEDAGAETRRRRRRRGGRGRRSRTDIPVAAGGDDATSDDESGDESAGYAAASDATAAGDEADDGETASWNGHAGDVVDDDGDDVAAFGGDADDHGFMASDDAEEDASGEAADEALAGAADDAGDDAEAEVELTDVLALAEAEAARLTGLDAATNGHGDASLEPPAPQATSQRFVIDLRSGSSS